MVPDVSEFGIDEAQVTVEQCFVLREFNEENPLYLLDVGGYIMVLFGQWLYDPHVLIASEDVCENWDAKTGFFGTFGIRWSMRTGTVFELVVKNPSLIHATRLNVDVRFKTLCDCQLVKGSSETLVRDLRNATVITD